MNCTKLDQPLLPNQLRDEKQGKQENHLLGPAFEGLLEGSGLEVPSCDFCCKSCSWDAFGVMGDDAFCFEELSILWSPVNLHIHTTIQSFLLDSIYI